MGNTADGTQLLSEIDAALQATRSLLLQMGKQELTQNVQTEVINAHVAGSKLWINKVRTLLS